MEVTHAFRQFDGRQLVGRGEDSPLAAYTALPKLHWLPSFIIELERADFRIHHPDGKEWRFVLQLDYHGELPPRATLIVKPTVYAIRSPSFSLVPHYPLSVRQVRGAIRRHLSRLG